MNNAMLLAGAGALVTYLMSRSRRIPLEDLYEMPSVAFDASSNPETETEAETGDLLITLVEAFVSLKAASLGLSDVVDFEITGLLEEGFYSEETDSLIYSIILETVGDTVEQSTKDKYIERYEDPEYALEFARLLLPSLCDLYPSDVASILDVWESRGGNETYGPLACTEN